jgi:hypothetical protein
MNQEEWRTCPTWVWALMEGDVGGLVIPRRFELIGYEQIGEEI